jgi:hypothetical protein
MIYIHEPPPQQQDLAAEVRSVFRMSMAIGACDRLRYQVDEEAGFVVFQATAQRALDAGMPQTRVRSLFNEQGDIVKAEWDAALAIADDLPPDQAAERLRTGMTFLINECKVQSSAHPTVLKADGDEVTTNDQFQAMMASGE